MLKFQVERGIVTIRSTVLIPTECTSVITSSTVSKDERTRPDNFKVALHLNFPDQEVAIGGTLSDKGRTELCSILKKNLNIFAWQPSDMTRVSRSVAERRLNIREGYSLVRQKKRGQAPERTKAIQVEHLSKLPILVAPKPKEELIIYLSATYGAISAVLMTERGATQTPIYFISRALQGPELNYTPMEKLVLSLVFAAKRLRRTATKIEYHARRTQYYLHAKNVGQRTDLSEFSHRDAGRKLTSRASGRNLTRAVDTFHGWLIIADGSEKCTSEYEALIAGLRIAAQMGVKNVHVSVDSKLVANQVLGMYVAKEDNMVKYLDKVKSLRWEGGNKDPHQSPTVRVNGGNSLQAVVPHAVVKMCWIAPGGGIDIAGPFPEGPGKVKNLIVAMDYFTKWIEAKPVATITGGQVKKFIWDNIVCRFGLPSEIVSDNGKQLSDNPFKDWHDKLNITQPFTSVKHLQSNRIVERENRILREGIKARLGEGNKNWVEELPHVIWAHRTMIKSSHDDTPFSLTYGTEAVIPTKVGMPTYCTTAVDIASNDEELRLNC
nr:reverse transcriptase domain-containing protein [Tanacetum cinerariifolium]